MATGSILNNQGKKLAINRIFKATPDYTAPSQFKVGINNGTPNVANTDLTEPIPIGNGTVLDDGDNQLTGSGGGSNTTDNTTTYKEGANQSDNTAQDLLATTGSATKTWTIADLSANGSLAAAAQPVGFWLYIKDATALAKFLSSGTCLSLRIGSDTSNYYYKNWEASDLSTGWNWLHSGSTNLEDLDENGTVSGNLDTFQLEIITNNATDTFTTGDVVYDLLRQWEASDLWQDYVSGYPTLDETNFIATSRCYLSATQASGFDITGLGSGNADSTPLMAGEDTMNSESKADTDEFVWIIKDQIIP